MLIVGASIIAAHVTAFTLDESVLQASAVHYTSNLPTSLLHDVNARATDRLYSLVLSIAFRLFNNADAVRIDHVLSVALFVSAAAPIYLWASLVLHSRWKAVSAALLSVAVPWLALTSALFTENLSYPLFWWMMLAVSASLWNPSPLRDCLALFSMVLLIATRAQFAAVFIGYLLALIVLFALRSDSRKGARRIALTVATIARRCPLTSAVVVVAIGAFAYAKSSGQWTSHIETLLGTYSNVVVNKGVPANMVEAVSVELIALALGVGLLPALISIVWYVRSLVPQRPHERRWVVLVGAGILLAVFVFLTAYAQFGYLGAITEERYFFYVIPVLWIGTFAALEHGGVKPGDIVLCSLPFAALYGAIPFLTPGLTQETAFLAPVEAIVPHVIGQRLLEAGISGPTSQDVLALFAIVAALATATVWRRVPRFKRWWTIGVPLVIQLMITGYAYAVVNGDIEGIPGRTGGSVAALGWVDRYAKSDDVWWFDNVSLATPPADPAGAGDNQARTTLFWNSRIRSWASLPALGLPPPEWPMTSLPNASNLALSAKTGALLPASVTGQIEEVVGATNSQFLQLEGETVARSPDGLLTLTRLSQPARARWLATGLQPDGYVATSSPVKLVAFSKPRAGERALHVVLRFLAPPAPTGPNVQAQSSMRLDFGSFHGEVVLKTSSSRKVALTACVARGDLAASGTLRAVRTVAIEGRELAGMLASVVISPANRHQATSCAHR